MGCPVPLAAARSPRRNGTDIATTNSTTQLSANWDAATDSFSGISGYMYFIYSTSGGGQLVQDGTRLGNVTTVTATGLSLTIGQTYYFTVAAINGLGRFGPSTNSDGQTVIAPLTVTSTVVNGGALGGGNQRSLVRT